MRTTPVIYTYSICMPNLDDDPILEGTVSYAHRSERAIDAQRLAVAQRAELAAARIDAPSDAIITVSCDDADPDVRFYEFFPVGVNDDYERVTQNRD